ncbi:MAG: FG-GAP repeat protein [Candidatus Thiodiazotropha lotti]|nr:FG-GAP repeat protein [Candidatus Thiodiazotropha lotti]MCW4220151.1 FG-GAP repeat protein [Candidatus Thiodiazotropha lotti]
MKWLRVSGIIALVLFQLTGCGGGGGDNDDSSSTIKLSVSAAGLKLLRFSWNDTGADHYKLLKNPDGNSGYTQLGEDLTDISMDEEISVHLTDWLNASYLVQACDANGGCVDSTPIDVSSLMLDLIGYLKARQISREYSFGYSIALSADETTLAIGAVGDASTATGVGVDPAVGGDNSATYSGAVNLYVRDGAGWRQQAYIKASNTGMEDLFGFSISLSEDGNTLAVSAVAEASAASGIDGDQADNSVQGAGAVYLFRRNEGVWSQEAYIKASNSRQWGVFGYQVSLSGSGDRLAVGSGGYAYLFEWDGSDWSQQAMLEPSIADEDNSFGEALSLSSDGSTLAVSAPWEDVSQNNTDEEFPSIDAGAAYVFVSGPGGWTEQAHIQPTEIDDLDGFGTSVSLSANGNTLAVGSLWESSSARGIDADSTDNSADESGAVYLFERNTEAWSQTAFIKASNAEQGDEFGHVLALSGDGNTLAVGALEDSIARGINGDQADNSARDSGAVYLFTRDNTSWRQQAYVKAPNTDQAWDEPGCIDECDIFNDWFGYGIAISSDGSVLAVGAPYDDSGDSANPDDDSTPLAGAVYLY